MNEVLLVPTRSQLDNKSMSSARIKISVGDSLLLLVERDFWRIFGRGLDTVSAPLDMPRSSDLITYNWESEVTVRSRLIQGRALVEVYRKFCELCILWYQKEYRKNGQCSHSKYCCNQHSHRCIFWTGQHFEVKLRHRSLKSTLFWKSKGKLLTC